MAHLTGTERARYVQGMFTRIARRYDLMNRLMTAGQDVRWRRDILPGAARHSGIPYPGRVLSAGQRPEVFQFLLQGPVVRPLGQHALVDLDGLIVKALRYIEFGKGVRVQVVSTLRG